MQLIMLSAMYENGGNVTHRHLDGHPQLMVYPFESQPGTRLCVTDELSSMFPFKYRWPVFPSGIGAVEAFEAIFDEEYKTRTRRPGGSKFRDADLQVDETARRDCFVKLLGDRRDTGSIVKAWLQSSFDAWTNFNRPANAKALVGYSPAIVVDSERMFADDPESLMVHVHRDPVAAYAETCRRPFPLSLERYAWTWATVQHRALVYKARYPERIAMVRYEQLITDKRAAMEQLAKDLGLEFADTMLSASWNGQVLDNVYPWGTIDFPDEDEQARRLADVPEERAAEIRRICGPMLERLGYA